MSETESEMSVSAFSGLFVNFHEFWVVLPSLFRDTHIQQHCTLLNIEAEAAVIRFKIPKNRFLRILFLKC